MGSYTCAVSRFPILRGDRVRLFLLTQNPYHAVTTSSCYITDLWFPRTFPLQAEYSDYELAVAEEGPAQDLWIDGFKLDLVERGWGENSIHDVPCLKTWTFDQLQEALRKGRVLVKPKYQEPPPYEVPQRRLPIPRSIPTRQRVERLLVKAGKHLYAGQSCAYAVDSLVFGEVRLRWLGFGEGYGQERTRLKEVWPLFGRYARVIRAAENHQYELMLYPKEPSSGFPGIEWYRKHAVKPPLGVAPVMIREDVWQALLKKRLIAYPKSFYIADYRRFALTLFEQLRAVKPNDHWWVRGDRDNPLSRALREGLVPFTVGLDTHFSLMSQKDLTPRQIWSFCSAAAELLFVQRILEQFRFLWMPGQMVGSQFEDFSQHSQLLHTFRKIAEECALTQK